MNKKLNSILSVAALGSALFLVPASVRASDTPATDPVAEQLAVTGNLAVKNVGPSVEIGSYRLWVRARLGVPSARLQDGSWLYNNFHADGSVAEGTVVIRFEHGRVSEMSLVSPAVAVAMLKAPLKVQETAMVARQ